MGRGSSAALMVVVLVAACGGDDDDEAPGRDAGVDAAPDASAPPCARAAPAAPAPAECPRGWHEDATGFGCAPWPDDEPARDCEADEAHFPGGSGCERIGTACVEDDPWASDLPEGADVLYVQAGAGAGGAGTRDDPFGSITLAVSRARGGEVIALSKGTFDEAPVVNEEVTLWGACVAETIVAGNGTNVTLALGADLTVKNLTARGSVWTIASDHDVDLDGVLVADAADGGVVVLDGTLTAHDLIVRGPGSKTGQSIAVDVFQGAHAELERTSLEGFNAGARVYEPGSALTARDTVIREAVPDVDGEFGFGLQVSEEGSATLERTAIERCHGAALYVVDDGTHVEATNLWAARTEAVERDGTGGYGAAVGYGARLDVTGATFVDDRYGLAVSDGAVATIDGVLVASSRRSGLLVQGEGSLLTASDLVVVDTTDATGAFGHGIGVSRGAALVLERALVENSQSWGIAVQGIDGTAALAATDVTIRDVAPRGSDGLLGRGLEVANGAAGELHRVAISAGREVGLAVLSDASLEGEDVLVESTRSNEDGAFGMGMLVADVSSATLTCFEVRGNKLAGVVAETGSAVSLDELLVVGTEPAECEASSCVGLGGGFGLAALNGATLTARRFQVLDNALGGVQVALDGEMDLHDGEVRRNPIGANVQDATFALDRLQDDVLFDNARNFDGQALPLPNLDDLEQASNEP